MTPTQSDSGSDLHDKTATGKATGINTAPIADGKLRSDRRSSIDKAIGYTLGIYPRLYRYLDDGRYHIDNNMSDNAVRPPCARTQKLPLLRISQCRT